MVEEMSDNGMTEESSGTIAPSSGHSVLLRGILSFWGLTALLLVVVAVLLVAVLVRRRSGKTPIAEPAEVAAISIDTRENGDAGVSASEDEGRDSQAAGQTSSGMGKKDETDDDDELEEDDDGVQKPEGETDKTTEVTVSSDGYGYPRNAESLGNLRMEEDDDGITVTLPNARSMRLVRVKSGAFIIGSKERDGGRSLHEPEKNVTLTDDFWIGVHEVTRGEWKAVMENVTSIRDDGDDLPMVDVNRNDALAFCGVLNDIFGEELPLDYMFGLPTVAQWEYACRGGNDGQDTRFSGSDDIGEVAWFAENSKDAPHEVASLKPNELGLYDMSGNVAEYCRDNTTGGKGGKDPCGDGQEEWQGIRGGSYDSAAFQCRVSAFERLSQRHGRCETVGFRIGIVPRIVPKDEEDEKDGAALKDEKQSSDDGAKKTVASAASDKKPEDAQTEEKAKDDEKAKDGEKEKGKEKKSRYSTPLLKTRSESLDHKRAVTSDLKHRKLLNTRDETIGGKEEKDEKEKEGDEGEKKDGKDTKRKRRASAQLLHTRDADILKRDDDKSKEGEKDGKAKSGRRSSAQLLHTRDGKDTIDIKRRKLLQTRDDDNDQPEEKEEEKEDAGGKKGKRKKWRRASAQLLQTRDGKDTIDIKGRTLLQTRDEQQSKADAKKQKENADNGKSKEKAADDKSKENPVDAKPKEEKPPQEVKTDKQEMFDMDGREAPVPLKKGLDLILVRVGEGRFAMGSEAKDSEGAEREVEISEAFWLGKFEVTQEQFEAVMGYNPSLMTGNPRLPVDNVTYMEAEDFCDVLNEKFAEHLPEGYVFALPSEAQWEYASRGGRKGGDGAFSGGDDADATAWHVGNSGGRTHLPGEKDENPLGIFDMSGNVSEWCRDYCERGERLEVVSDAYGEGGRDPVGEEGDYRIRRGGAWCFAPDACRSDARTASAEEFKANYVGFRLALVPVQGDDDDDDDDDEAE